ncbi:MAG: glycoside hydrolase family 3 protein [Thermotogaceae bacterium]|nr:glycoside hydrolase family 3 protein [Thermotogaceae bacterium]
MIKNLGKVFFVGLNKFDDETKVMIEKYMPGGVLLKPGVLSDYTLTVAAFKFLNETGKFLISSDHEGGQMETIPYIPSSPGNLSFGFAPSQMIYKYTHMAGSMMRLIGFNNVFAPVIDLLYEGSAPVVGFRSFGKDPVVVADHGIHAMKGYMDSGILPCLKHFPGHGRAKVDSHERIPVIDASYEELQKTDIYPFEKAIDEGAEMIMTAHIIVKGIDDVPASISKKVVKDILIDNLGFKGIVISDAAEMKALSDNYSVEEILKNFFEAGGNMILMGDEELLPVYYKTLERMILAGELSKKLIEGSIEKVETVIGKYHHSESIGFFADVAKKALKFKIRSKLPKKVHVVLPVSKNLSPADTSEKFYEKYEAIFKNFFDVVKITEYEISKGPVIEKSDEFILDIVVDAFRSEEAVNNHISLNEKAPGVLYIIVRDPYDEKFFKDFDCVVTHSMNPISLYETLTIFKEVGL